MGAVLSCRLISGLPQRPTSGKPFPGRPFGPLAAPLPLPPSPSLERSHAHTAAALRHQEDTTCTIEMCNMYWVVRHSTFGAIKSLGIHRTWKRCVGQNAKLCVESPPVLRFPIGLIYLEVPWKTYEKSAVFTFLPEKFDGYPLYRNSENGR